MSTRLLSILLPAALAVFALAAFVAVDFMSNRGGAGSDTGPNFSEYVASFVRKDRATEDIAPETVDALGEVPHSGAESAQPDTEVVTRNETAPSTWFRRDQTEKSIQVEFTCVKGVGGAKVCTAETMRR